MALNSTKLFVLHLKDSYFSHNSSFTKENELHKDQVFNLILLNYWLILLISFSFLFIAVKRLTVLTFIVYYISFLLIVELLKFRANVIIAGKVLIFGVWSMITTVCIMEGTVLNIFASWYISLGIVAAILLGKKSFYIFTTITLVTSFLIVFLNTGGLIIQPFFPVPPLVSWFILIIAFIQSIIPIYVTIENLTTLSEDLELKVIERTTRLEEANKDLELYINSLSHDLRTPLEINNGLIEILKEQSGDQLSQSGKELLDRISSNSTKTNQMAKDLLYFFSIKHKTLNKEQIDMNVLLSQSLESLKGLALRKNVNLEIDQLPKSCGDPILITQVWTNLLSNAFKYTENEQNPFIKIGFITKNKNTIYFIKDNGIGFDMSESEKLFQPFQRLQTGKRYEGSGIGLAFVHSIISKHGGFIWVEAEKNNGATFFFTLC